MLTNKLNWIAELSPAQEPKHKNSRHCSQEKSATFSAPQNCFKKSSHLSKWLKYMWLLIKVCYYRVHTTAIDLQCNVLFRRPMHHKHSYTTIINNFIAAAGNLRCAISWNGTTCNTWRKLINTLSISFTKKTKRVKTALQIASDFIIETFRSPGLRPEWYRNSLAIVV